MKNSAEQKKSILIGDLKSARSEVLAVVQAMHLEWLDLPCTGTWCAKDLLAHMIGWDFTNLEAVQEILAGNRPHFFQFYDKDWSSYNASLVQKHRVDSLQGLLQEIAASHQALISYLECLPAQVLVNAKSPKEQGRTISIANLLRSEASDERAHAVQLKRFIRELQAVNPV